MRIATLVLWGMLLAQAGLLGWTASVAAPGPDERAHMVGGLFSWRFGRFDLYKVNPPLVELVSTAPVAAAGYAADWTEWDDRPGMRPQWEIGADWLAANGARGLRLFVLARWAVIPPVVLGGLGCFLWARDLYDDPPADGEAVRTGEKIRTGEPVRRHETMSTGERAGLLACGLWCFNPSLLAHGALITPDAAAAGAGVWAGYTFWRFLKDQTPTAALLAGTLLGAANAVKTTWVILFVLWPALWLLWTWAARRSASELAATNGSAPDAGTLPLVAAKGGAWKRFGSLVLVLVTGVYLLNACYGFEGTFTRLGEFRFVSETLAGPVGARATPGDADGVDDGAGNRFAGTILSGVPVPVPRNWVLGVDVQRRDFERPHRSYLFGTWRRGGWPHYYLAAFAVKEPLGLFAVLGLAAVAFTLRPVSRLRDEAVLLVPPLAVLALVSSQTNMSHHPRYLLPAYGFLFVWCGQAVRLAGTGGKRVFGVKVRRASAGLLGVAAAACVVAGVWCVPYPHAFFNAAAGGPLAGHRHLAGSGLDWGQSAGALAAWQRAHPDRPLDGVELEGRLDPAVYGLTTAGVPHVPRPGRWAIAAGELTEPGFARWRDLEPAAVVGGNLRIYEVP